MMKRGGLGQIEAQISPEVGVKQSQKDTKLGLK
jgi:hypothetical protein